MDLVTDSTLVIELNGTTAGTEYDQILTEGLILTGNLDVSLGYEPNIGDAFTLNDVSNGLVVGNFSGMPEGTVFNLDGYLMSISYQGGDGNDVVLTVDREAIYYVDADATNTGTNDGESLPSTFLTIQDALMAAESNSAIWVAEGTFYPDEGGMAINDDTNSSFVLEHMVHLYGGFAGGETELNQRDPSSNLTILSGDIDNNDLNSDGNDIAESTNDIQGSNAIHVVNGANVSSDTVLDGFIITAGQTQGKGTDQIGAGMYCGTGTTGPSINDTMFIGNHAQNRGAASFGCAQNVTQTSYLYNRADDLAGAVFTTGGGYMDDVWFKGNFAQIQASAMLTEGLTMELSRATFIGNGNGQGGGGAIRGGGEIMISSSLFLGNRANHGGAIFMTQAHDLYLTNVTMAGNHALQQGGAVYQGETGEIFITNGIIWNNQDSSGIGTADASVVSVNTPVTIDHSLIQGFGTSGIGNLDEDPRFHTDADPTSAPSTSGNARLQFGSPALNVGDNASAPAGTDLDGNARIQDTVIDMGAYEGFDDVIFKDGFE